MEHKCFCCKEEANYSILLAGFFDVNNYERGERVYLPNQYIRKDARRLGQNRIPIPEVWFCKKCMRKIEDNLNETIDSLIR
jgi:hypothetical protein